MYKTDCNLLMAFVIIRLSISVQILELLNIFCCLHFSRTSMIHNKVCPKKRKRKNAHLNFCMQIQMRQMHFVIAFSQIHISTSIFFILPIKHTFPTGHSSGQPRAWKGLHELTIIDCIIFKVIAILEET